MAGEWEKRYYGFRGSCETGYVELFDVACLLSRWEGFGLALPEYMMAGKPIVASRVDAIPNIIRDGENRLSE